MRDIIHFGVFLMKDFEKNIPEPLGKAIGVLIAKKIIEYVGERNLSIIEEELKSNQ